MNMQEHGQTKHFFRKTLLFGRVEETSKRRNLSVERFDAVEISQELEEIKIVGCVQNNSSTNFQNDNLYDRLRSSASSSIFTKHVWWIPFQFY